MTFRRKKYGECALCEREIALTFHHLIPKKMHRRTYFKKHFAKVTLNEGINICRQCHVGIHKSYDEMRLAKTFNTLEKLQSDPVINAHIAWVKKQKIVTK